jgi:hypothetical protein
LEEALSYYHDLHIDAGTKKLILNLLSSIRTVVPVASPPVATSLDAEPGHMSLDQIRNVLILARQHSEELDGLFNPDELHRYIRYASDYQDIIKHLENILAELKSCRNSALKFASGMADMVEDHIQMCSSDRKFPKPMAADGGMQESVHFNRDGIKLKVV